MHTFSRYNENQPCSYTMSVTRFIRAFDRISRAALTQSYAKWVIFHHLDSEIYFMREVCVKQTRLYLSRGELIAASMRMDLDFKRCPITQNCSTPLAFESFLSGATTK